MKLTRVTKLLVLAVVFELACVLWAHGFARDNVGLVAGQSSHAAHALTRSSIAMCITAIAAQMTATLVGPVLVIACIVHLFGESVLERIALSRGRARAVAAKKAGKKA